MGEIANAVSPIHFWRSGSVIGTNRLSLTGATEFVAASRSSICNRTRKISASSDHAPSLKTAVSGRQWIARFARPRV